MQFFQKEEQVTIVHKTLFFPDFRKTLTWWKIFQDFFFWGGLWWCYKHLYFFLILGKFLEIIKIPKVWSDPPCVLWMKKGLLCHIGQAHFFLLKLLTSNSEKTIKNDKNSKRFTFSKILNKI